MPIPMPQIPIELKKDTPTKVDVAELRQELNAIGLTCDETTVEKLQKSKEDVLKQIHNGKFEGYLFYQTRDTQQIAQNLAGGKDLTSFDQVFTALDLHAEWQPNDTPPYAELLRAVGQPTHFDYLMKNYLTFPGQKSDKDYKDNKTTVDAIKKTFVEIANNIASTVVAGLNKDLMEAALARVISVENPPSNSDYDSGLQNRSILLVADYDGKFCEGIGVVNVEYQLKIKNYKEKKHKHNESTLNVTVRTAIYTDIQELKDEVKFLQAHFKNRLFVPQDIPMPDARIIVYKDLPKPSDEVFIHSLPMQQTENDITPVMVLYGPDLESVGSIDNTGSPSSVSYSQTVTSGFSSTLGFKIGGSTKFAAGALFTKAEVSINMEVSFSAQWNTSHSETITYNVPANAKAYLYQGYFHCAILVYNAKTMKYSYKDECAFRSNIIKTTAEPIPDGSVVHYDPVVKNNAEQPLWEILTQ